MTWLNPATTPPPTVGEFIAKFRSKSGIERKVVLRRTYNGIDQVIGVAGGVFEFDLGEMAGWHPLPEGLD